MVLDAVGQSRIIAERCHDVDDRAVLDFPCGPHYDRALPAGRRLDAEHVVANGGSSPARLLRRLRHDGLGAASNLGGGRLGCVEHARHPLQLPLHAGVGVGLGDDVHRGLTVSGSSWPARP